MAKERILVILENLGGSLSVAEALRRTGMSRTLFHNLRMAALGAALKAVEPRPRGRPLREHPGRDGETRRLEVKIERLEEDLAFTRAREELALLAPGVGRRQKKIRRPPAWRRVDAPSGRPSDSKAGAAPGSFSPGASASAQEPSTPGGGTSSPDDPSGDRQELWTRTPPSSPTSSSGV